MKKLFTTALPCILLKTCLAFQSHLFHRVPRPHSIPPQVASPNAPACLTAQGQQQSSKGKSPRQTVAHWRHCCRSDPHIPPAAQWWL
jgi:hypothetical protein